ncbi:MAG: hypothetical protein ACRYGK_06270 [Janthinobacterium lividum]
MPTSLQQPLRNSPARHPARARWQRAAALGTMLALLLGAGAAAAFDRMFPPNTKRGTLSTEAYPVISINGKERQLSAGAWIRNENNTIDMPASLAGRRMVVNYTENGMGQIDRVWILTSSEASIALPDPLKPAEVPVAE